MRSLNRGYVLLDILIGLFILGLGFAVIQGLTQSAALSYAQSHNLLQAANLAGSTIHSVTSDLKKDPAVKYAYFNQEGLDQVGKYQRQVSVQWDTPDLLLITVEVGWPELGEFRNYRLESLCYVRD